MLWNKHNLTVAKFAAKNGIREELASMYFLKDKTVATDTFRLLEVSVPADVKIEDFPQVQGKSAMRGCEPFLVDARSVASIKLPKSKLPILQHCTIKHCDKQYVEFLTTDGEIAESKTLRRIDGQFPDYEQIFPKDEPKAEVYINGKMLGELLTAMSELSEDKGVTIRFFGEENPLVLLAESKVQKARGIMMPMRKD